jgi:hypothetical protein
MSTNTFLRCTFRHATSDDLFFFHGHILSGRPFPASDSMFRFYEHGWHLHRTDRPKACQSETRQGSTSCFRRASLELLLRAHLFQSGHD